MNPDEAREALLLHSFAHPDLNHPKMEAGFLGSLRPYRGLNKENFLEVMEAIRALAPELQKQEVVDRKIISALWNICFQTWAIALQSGGALNRNSLIDAQETEQLESWLFDIFFAVSILLEGGEINDAIPHLQPE